MAVECFKCKFLHITWDQQQPRGCKAYGFKTARTPSLIVKENSGKECELYTPKDSISRGKDPELDLNDKSNW